MVITNVNELREDRIPSQFNFFDSYKGISIINRGLTKNPRFEFNERVEFIFSESFLTDNLRLCSLEQQAMLERYFVQADLLPTTPLDDDLNQLDIFLGGL